MALNLQSNLIRMNQNRTDDQLRENSAKSQQLFNQTAKDKREQAAQIKADSDSERALGQRDSKVTGGERLASMGQAAGDVAKKQVGSAGAAAIAGAEASADTVQKQAPETYIQAEQERIGHEQKGYDRRFDAENAKEQGNAAERAGIQENSAFQQYLNENREKALAQRNFEMEFNARNTNANAAAQGSQVGTDTQGQQASQAAQQATGATTTPTTGGSTFHATRRTSEESDQFVNSSRLGENDKVMAKAVIQKLTDLIDSGDPRYSREDRAAIDNAITGNNAQVVRNLATKYGVYSANPQGGARGGNTAQ